MHVQLDIQMAAVLTHHSILQQILQPCGCGGAIAAVFLSHVVLHFLHLVLSLFHIGKELQRDRECDSLLTEC